MKKELSERAKLSEKVKQHHLTQLEHERKDKVIRIELSPAEIEADLKLDEQIKNACYTIQKRLSKLEWVVGLPELSSRFVPYCTLFEMANRTMKEIYKNASSWKLNNTTRAHINNVIDHLTEIEKLLLQKQEEYQKEAIFSMDEVELVG